MKKVLLLMLSVAFFASCSPTQNAAKQSAKDFRGDWTLTSVTPREAGIQITSLFNQAPQSCFVGSSWHLVANNNSGNYIFNNVSCSSEPNKINWHMTNENGVNYFWFKRIAAGEKAKNVLTGYKLKVENISDYQAHLSQEVPVGNQKTIIDYYFTKTSK
ncbi:hypothetical protein [Ornithobacterium rhinotracheale]|uniref:Lipocalin-like domain-containing protein n=1 Tax=Ornithobacterium rhinotracheale (strain ATCC 51463 / DSM 15997 / CCUG 23171 / CIP 104009 / LMG 9086) TaxID=867902 RepID=I3ZZL5_ORNRL|nr:hypothetical protein [Ornithobacterium rhinotracheale]AFL97149.1 hypothetical protein Ornrh_0956 [Ornithobacterium rhinotracheale DSM 15997]AIP99248.1 lipocalin [Ornithobacterium rhinotracheale ORT-UMN 88]KGB67445.1 hypothetical protein Q787_05245 [Ornithobacterium rhinotracheale H06-030791]MCK0194329.1 hypothetical protein [Ornithobacterium rhinotracheale]MCK0199860.1 hypothetical protein [Ornithobacterium rhinotracheale]